MKRWISAVLAAALVTTIAYKVGAQTQPTQSSATLKVSCMSDGTMRLSGVPVGTP